MSHLGFRAEKRSKGSVRKEIKSKPEAIIPSIPLPNPIYAKVTWLPMDDDEKNIRKEKNSYNNDSRALERVKKVLQLANHQRTNENEAKQALRASAKILKSANLAESQVILHESAEKQVQRGGRSRVTIRRRDGSYVEGRKWTESIAYAVKRAFNVKHYYKRGPQGCLYVIFYGIRDNTVAAAMSFEAVFNLCITWAAKGKNKNCYLLGISSSIYEMSKAQEKEEELQAIENEERLSEKYDSKRMKMKSSRSEKRINNNNKVTIVKDEKDEDEGIIFVGIKRATSSSSHEKVKGEVKYEQKEDHSTNRKRSREEEAEVVGWQSHVQLMQFRRMAERIADDYLRELGRTLVPGVTGERATVHDYSMHVIGREQARNVDLKRRRLEAA